jgi:hypothetical protein
MSCSLDPSLFEMLHTEFASQLAKVKIPVTQVKLKMGNEISSIPLV